MIKALRAALYDYDPATVRAALIAAAPNAVFHLAFPFETMEGPEAYFDTALTALHTALPDLERREQIVVQGADDDGAAWIGMGGFYTGTFRSPFLDIPPTGHLVHMRFHEFFRIEDGKIVEMQALWDIPEVMMQAGAWPMSPSLGREWHIPGPATGDGLGPHDPSLTAFARQHVIDMLLTMKKHPSEGGPEKMELERFWHPRMNWYGPAGIGTGRGIEGFRNWHQIPFLNAMPDRGTYPTESTFHFMAEGNYVGVTGWPDMVQTISHAGWLGLPPVGKKITMRSLDFWRIENGLIRENWVLVDLLHMYDQIGIDVFARIREFNKARQGTMT